MRPHQLAYSAAVRLRLRLRVEATVCDTNSQAAERAGVPPPFFRESALYVWRKPILWGHTQEAEANST
jgi:hypothetical protein